MNGTKIGIGVVAACVIVFAVLLLTGASPLYERNVLRSPAFISGQPGERVIEFGTWWLNGMTFGDGKHGSRDTSSGLCYVITEKDGKKTRRLCRSVQWASNRDTGQVTFTIK